MPNRMLRDWTQSDKVDLLSAEAERFFVRLIMKVDDYGCFYAHPGILRANLFALKLDKIREADISRWLGETHKAGLIALYEYEGKQYLQINDFRQRLDRAKAKFPLPLDSSPLTIVNDFPPEQRRNRTETESEQRREQYGGFDRSPTKPTLEKVKEEFYRKGGNNEMAERFFNKYEALGWHLNNTPIKNFASLVQNFIASWKENRKDLKEETKNVKIAMK